MPTMDQEVAGYTLKMSKEQLQRIQKKTRLNKNKEKKISFFHIFLRILYACVISIFLFDLVDRIFQLEFMAEAAGIPDGFPDVCDARLCFWMLLDAFGIWSK